MNEKTTDPKSNCNHAPAEPDDSPNEVQAGDAAQKPSMRERLSRMAELIDQGDSPAELRELQAACQAEHELQIKAIRAFRREQDHAATLELIGRRSEFIARIQAEICRSDLTIPETFLLQNLISELERDLWKSLSEPACPATKPSPLRTK